ncbi:MAG: Bug family tripartite tricarboxylate transporter substrate binding protein [Burkholderiales bacterium]
MFRPRIPHCILPFAFALLASTANAQTSGKTIRWIVPFPPGGIADVLARLISAQISPMLGQTIVVENRAGAGGMIGTELVAKGPPDGSMLMIAGSVVPTSPFLYKNLSFNPVKDLQPVVQVGYTSNVLVLAADHPINSVKELVEAARKNPGKLNYATVGRGSFLQLAAIQFMRDTGTQLVEVGYKGGGDNTTAIITRQVDFQFDNMVFSLPQVRGGKMKALAVTSRERDPSLPNVPTMIELGFPGFEFLTWNGVWTTGGSPAETVARLEGAMRKVVATPEFAQSVQKFGIRVTNLSSREMTQIIEEETVRWAKIFEFGGIKPE